MPKEPEHLNDEQLNAKLTETLENFPLYTEYRYIGANQNVLPKTIQRFCPQCRRDSDWQHMVNRNQFASDRAPFVQRSYTCANCKVQIVYFVYSWREERQTVEKKTISIFSFRKYGQWPPIEQRISPQLEKALEKSDDLDFYKAALRLRNFGNGIGAMAYMRRVIENLMSDMLQILSQEAEAKGLQPLSKEEIKEKRFSDKVADAEKLFPALITPHDYPNPFLPLYKLTSDALHNLSEAESVALFDECRNVFEYVFSSLRPHLNEQKKFLEDLQKLARKSATVNETEAKSAKP